MSFLSFSGAGRCFVLQGRSIQKGLKRGFLFPEFEYRAYLISLFGLSSVRGVRGFGVASPFGFMLERVFFEGPLVLALTCEGSA